MAKGQSWIELTSAIDRLQSPTGDENETNALKQQWLVANMQEQFTAIHEFFEGQDVIFYSSAWLQKPTAPAYSVSIAQEDLNGLMSVVRGLDCTRGLVLILHTPGGVTVATETIVDYLRSKFKRITVIVPAFAMSAGTMISLAADTIIMGRQSQLGPIDPQMAYNNTYVSAIAIIEQFERAKQDILANVQMAHVWANPLAQLGPSLLQEARNAIEYSHQIVAEWLAKYTFSAAEDPNEEAARVADFFSQLNDPTDRKKNHGRRINIAEAKAHNLNVVELENNQVLQEAVLTLYHLVTMLFEKSPATKLIANHHMAIWLKQHV